MAHRMTNSVLPDNKLSLDLITLFAVIGFASFWTSMLSTLFKTVFAFGEDAPLMRGAFVLCFTLAFAGVQFLSYTRLVDQTATLRIGRRLALVAAVAGAPLTIAGVLAVGLGVIPPELILVCCLLAGAGAGLLLVIWGSILTVLDAERPDGRTAALNIAWSILVAAIFGSVLIFTPVIVDVLASFAFLATSVFLLVFCAQHLTEPEFVDVRTSHQRLALFSRNLIPPLFMGFAWAIALGPLLFSDSAHLIILIALSSVLAAALLMTLLLLILKRVAHQSSIERWSFSLLACCLVLFALDRTVVELPETLRFALVFAMTCITVVYFISHWTVLLALSYRHRVSTLYHYGQGLIAPVGGIALGWALMYALESLGLVSTTTLTIVAMTSLLALVLIPAIAPYTTNNVVEDVFESPAGDTRGHWQRRCLAVCERHCLSPREIEVFLLLAKGRNAEYVSHTLFISTHTAKTHISRIYRKLAVNSQQELIDRVDETEV
jgi:DNA-binding CsgD family transcriptional regulator/MFS family permease